MGGLEMEDMELVARRQARDAWGGVAAEHPGPRDLRKAADLEPQDARLLRRLVGREVRRDPEPGRVHELRVRENRDLRGQLVAEELHGRRDRRVGLQRDAFADRRAGAGYRQMRRRRGRENERRARGDEEPSHAIAPRHI